MGASMIDTNAFNPTPTPYHFVLSHRHTHTIKHTGPIYVTAIEHSLSTFNVQKKKKKKSEVESKARQSLRGLWCVWHSLHRAAKWQGCCGLACASVAAPAWASWWGAGDDVLALGLEDGVALRPSGKVPLTSHHTLPHSCGRDLTVLQVSGYVRIGLTWTWQEVGVGWMMKGNRGCREG